MRRYLIALSFALCTLTPGVARAALCPPTHTFTTGETLTSTILNSNPVTTSNCLANLDYTNVGTAGFYASNLKPTNGTQATFGGAQTYTFPSGLNAGGAVTGTTGTFSSTVSGTNGTYSGTVTGAAGTFSGTVGVGALNSSGGIVGVGISGTTGTFSGGGSFGSSLTTHGIADQTGISTTGNATAGGHVAATSYVQGSYFSSNYSATQGLYYGGGSNTSQLDYNITNANEWTMTSPLVVQGGISSPGNISTSIGSFQQSPSGTAFTLPYDANSTSGSTNTHYEHNTATTGTYSGGVACSGTIGFIKTFSANPDIFFTIIPPATYTNATPYISSRSTSNFVVCWNSTGAASGTTSFSWLAVGE